MINSFPPFADANSEILILGTMPGAMSLAKQEYYAHKQNAFWKIIYSVFAQLPVAERFDEKIKLLQQNNIALWDVLENCERVGSLDINIKNHKENDILGLLKKHPKIRTIIFNGKESEKYFLRKFGVIEGIQFHQMPSTSPANTMKFDHKLKSWSEVLR
ncbi:MAG TPA: DNA-deoxyinosine glycosylase [Flavobacterium sp.]|nr:DNA-deoxyinosine glycosylase [Flavobacterium sp.]